MNTTKKYIFITGMGRSGTTFLTTLLSGREGIFSGHEYIGNREFWLLSWYLGSQYSLPYLTRVKSKIETEYTQHTFVDVNGRLQNCTDELKQIFSDCRVYHMVRDPRQVVRSLYTRRNEANIHLVPKEQSEIEKWLDGDKFYQVCWNWARTTQILLDKNLPVLIFEKLISDFDYCNNTLLKPSGIAMSVEEWQAKCAVKVNHTKPAWYRFAYAKIKGKAYVEDKLPAYEFWSPEQKAIFQKLCGPVMAELGYAT